MGFSHISRLVLCMYWLPYCQYTCNIYIQKKSSEFNAKGIFAVWPLFPYTTNPPHSQRKAKEAIFYDWLLPIHSALVLLHAWLPNALPQWLTGSLCGRASREAAPSVVLPVTNALWGSCWTRKRGVTNRNLGAKSLLTSVLSSRPPVIHPLFGALCVSLGPSPKTFQGLHTQIW